MDWKRQKLLGESIREIGVLVLVFVPLNLLLESNKIDGMRVSYPSWMAWMNWLSPEHLLTLFFTAAGIFLLYFGIKIEAEAQEEGDNNALSNDRI